MFLVLGLERFTGDEKICDYAEAHGLTVMTADLDFVRLAEHRGSRLNVIRLANCNYKTAVVEGVLRRNAIRITDFEKSDRNLLIIRNSE